MAKKLGSIPVNVMTDQMGGGISIETLTIAHLRDLVNANAGGLEEAKQSHRHDCHSFFLLHSGTVSIEIDFETYEIGASSVIYLHPNQVHRTTVFENVVVSALAITNENLNPDYLALLEDLTPAKPLVVKAEKFAVILEAAALCTRLFERGKDTLYQPLLKDGCNALVGLILSQYLEHRVATDKVSRFEAVSKAFRLLLERNYATVKRPAAYAQLLNISTPYLNECVKNATGYPVSHHIQQRVVLEAKRLLYHSGKSVKEIAAQLGYDDYPYFSRLFAKLTGTTAVAFRHKNRD